LAGSIRVTDRSFVTFSARHSLICGYKFEACKQPDRISSNDLLCCF